LFDILQLPGSKIKHLKLKPSLDQSDHRMQWMWRTPYQECSSNFPEDELTTYLHENSDLLQQLQAYREVLHDLAGTMVCQLDEDESPRGYSISPALMRLLIDANASLDIDIEYLG